MLAFSALLFLLSVHISWMGFSINTEHENISRSLSANLRTDFIFYNMELGVNITVSISLGIVLIIMLIVHHLGSSVGNNPIKLVLLTTIICCCLTYVVEAMTYLRVINLNPSIMIYHYDMFYLLSLILTVLCGLIVQGILILYAPIRNDNGFVTLEQTSHT